MMQLTEIVIACFNLEGMMNFYKNAFDLDCQAVEISQGKIYESHIDGLKIIFCPAKIAGISAIDNRHQLTFAVRDIRTCIEKIERLGGSFINDLEEANGYLQVAIRDIDNNSIVLKETI